MSDPVSDRDAERRVAACHRMLSRLKVQETPFIDAPEGDAFVSRDSNNNVGVHLSWRALKALVDRIERGQVR